MTTAKTTATTATDPITRIREALDNISETRSELGMSRAACAQLVYQAVVRAEDALTELEAEREADRARIRELEAGAVGASYGNELQREAFGEQLDAAHARICELEREADPASLQWYRDRQAESEKRARQSRLSAPAGDGELAKHIGRVRKALDGVSVTEQGQTFISTGHVIAAAEKWQRLQRETDEQRAERELGAWLVAHPGWAHGIEGRRDDDAPWEYRIELWRPDDGIRDEDGYEPTPWHPTKAAAILDALKKAEVPRGE